MWLGRQYRRAVASGVSLLTQLQTEGDARIAATETGQIVATTAGNGLSVGFSNPGAAGSTPAQMASLCGEMLRRYDDAKSTLGGSPTDAQIYAKMLADLVSIPAYGHEFADLTK
jgi:hypothetical protein